MEKRLFLAVKNSKDILTAVRINNQTLVFSMEDEVFIKTNKQHQRGVLLIDGNEYKLEETTHHSHLDAIDVAKLVLKDIESFGGEINGEMELIINKDENHVCFIIGFNGRQYRIRVCLAKPDSNWAKSIGSTLSMNYIDLGKTQVWQDELEHIMFKFS